MIKILKDEREKRNKRNTTKQGDRNYVKSEDRFLVRMGPTGFKETFFT